MSDVAREIVEFIKLKDRPSLFELRAFSNHGEEELKITAPIEEGRRVWFVQKVSRNKIIWQTVYPEHNLQGMAALVEGQIACKETGNLMLHLYRLHFIPLEAQWFIDPQEADTHQKRIDIITGALRTLLVE